LSFEWATFTDVGQVWGGYEGVDLSNLEVTPGVGVRYLSPVGPIRIDLAYRFGGGEPLAVITSRVRMFDPSVHEEDDRIRIDDQVISYVQTQELVALNPSVIFGETSPFSFRRLQLHISIGQAF
jgi:hypothetical protein